MSQMKTSKEDVSFDGLGLSQKLLDKLQKLNFTSPTDIQHKSIPVAVEGRDVIGIAQTGTGKTLAFVLPLLQQVARTGKTGLVVAPTRELAGQVEEQVCMVGDSLGFRRALLIGGDSIGKQVSQIRRRPHIMIGTPGRIIDLVESKRLTLDQVGILVLDEADRMLDMGFAPQINQILKHVSKERQTMLFSATMAPEITRMASEYMKMPVRVEVARAGTVAERVDQELFIVSKNDKSRLLLKLLEDYSGTVLVFSRTKHGAKRICKGLNHAGHNAAEIHSNLTLAQRRRALDGFKSGKYRVLVATDIAARGIDVTNIELVINYDLPDSPDDYVHRVGRTGRAGSSGKAISFITSDQRGKVRIIERLVRQRLSYSKLPELPKEGLHMPRERDDRDNRGYSQRGRGSRGQQRNSSGRGLAARSRSNRRVRMHH